MRDLLVPTGGGDGEQHEDRGDAGTDGGLGKGHVDRVEHDPERGHDQAVDAEHERGRQQVAQRDHDERRRDQQDQEQDINVDVYGAGSLGLRVQGRTPSSSAAWASACAAVGAVNTRNTKISTSLNEVSESPA